MEEKDKNISIAGPRMDKKEMCCKSTLSCFVLFSFFLSADIPGGECEEENKEKEIHQLRDGESEYWDKRKPPGEPPPLLSVWKHQEVSINWLHARHSGHPSVHQLLIVMLIWCLILPNHSACTDHFVGGLLRAQPWTCRLMDSTHCNNPTWDNLSLSQVSLLSFIVESEHTFLDYIKGGWVQCLPLRQLNMSS